MQARNATRTLEMVMDTILEAKHPLPTQPGSVELILGADQVEASHYAVEQARCRVREVWEVWDAWDALLHQDSTAVSPALAQVSFGRR